MTGYPQLSKKHGQLIQKSLMKIGRNVLEFQQIESFLKVTLPYMKAKGSSSAVMPYRPLKEALQNKTMLGELVKAFNKANLTDQQNDLEAYLADLVQSRNDLIHHFSQRLDGNLDTEEKCKSAISYLDSQYRLIEPMKALMREYGSVFAAFLDESISSEPEKSDQDNSLH